MSKPYTDHIWIKEDKNKRIKLERLERAYAKERFLLSDAITDHEKSGHRKNMAKLAARIGLLVYGYPRHIQTNFFHLLK